MYININIYLLRIDISYYLCTICCYSLNLSLYSAYRIYLLYLLSTTITIISYHCSLSLSLSCFSTRVLYYHQFCHRVSLSSLFSFFYSYPLLPYSISSFPLSSYSSLHLLRVMVPCYWWPWITIVPQLLHLPGLAGRGNMTSNLYLNALSSSQRALAIGALTSGKEDVLVKFQ